MKIKDNDIILFRWKEIGGPDGYRDGVYINYDIRIKLKLKANCKAKHLYSLCCIGEAGWNGNPDDLLFHRAALRKVEKRYNFTKFWHCVKKDVVAILPATIERFDMILILKLFNALSSMEEGQSE